jgi:hypothetical protein
MIYEKKALSYLGRMISFSPLVRARLMAKGSSRIKIEWDFSPKSLTETGSQVIVLL